MFRNLEAEITRGGYKKADIAQRLGITPSTLSLKLNGKAPLNLSEVVKIKAFLGVNIPIEILFDMDQEQKDNYSASVTAREEATNTSSNA